MRYYLTLATATASCALLFGCGKSEPESQPTAEVAAPGDVPSPGAVDPAAAAAAANIPAATAPPAGTPAELAALAASHPLPGDPEAGKEVYARVCVACHQMDGSGLNGMLAANFVADKTRLAKTNEVLLNSMRNGVVADNKVMPPMKDTLSEQEMKDALSYVRKTFGSK